MRYLAGIVLAVVLAGAMTGSGFAADQSFDGIWRPDKNLDFEVSLCGDDNSRICIKLVALRGKMDKPKNQQYLGTNIVDEAKPSGQNRWKGKIELFGQTGDATVTLRSDNELLVKACAYVVACKEYAMIRVQ